MAALQKVSWVSFWTFLHVSCQKKWNDNKKKKEDGSIIQDLQ